MLIFCYIEKKVEIYTLTCHNNATINKGANIVSKRRRRPIHKLFMSFCITVVIILIIIGGVYAAYRGLVRPPDVGDYVIIHLPIANQTIVKEPNSNMSYLLADYKPLQEEQVYEYVRFERRPLFYTILIYGLDDGFNADTIMLAAFDGNTGQAYLVSLPRDTHVESSRGVGRSKLVASYSAGRQGGRGHEGGIELLKTEVASLIGFRPDFYVQVNYRAFTRIVDAVGGVSVHIPFRMVYNDPYQNLHINLFPGQHRLNGQQALHFARFRQFNEGCPYFRNFTDFQRQANQQIIITSILNELLSTPRNIATIPELVRIYREEVITNMSTLEIAWFVDQASDLLGGSILSSYTLPIERTERRGWYEMPCKEGILELVNRTINPFIQDITEEMLKVSTTNA